MPYISKEDLEQARRIDLLTYLKACEPDELVSMGHEKYKLKSHDSLKLSNGKWFWWSHNIGGSTALDYLIRVKGIALPQAVLLLSKECGFFLCKELLPMFSNSEFLILLNQAPADRIDLAELFHISVNQMKHIENTPVGQGLLKVGEAMVPFVNQFPKDTMLYELMTTKPEDK